MATKAIRLRCRNNNVMTHTAVRQVEMKTRAPTIRPTTRISEQLLFRCRLALKTFNSSFELSFSFRCIFVTLEIKSNCNLETVCNLFLSSSIQHRHARNFDCNTTASVSASVASPITLYRLYLVSCITFIHAKRRTAVARCAATFGLLGAFAASTNSCVQCA